MSFLTPDDVARITGGRWLDTPPAALTAPIGDGSALSRPVACGSPPAVDRRDMVTGRPLAGRAPVRGRVAR